MSIKAPDISFPNFFGRFLRDAVDGFCADHDHPLCDRLLTADELTVLFYAYCKEGHCASIMGINTPKLDLSKYPEIKPLTESDAAAVIKTTADLRTHLATGPWDKLPDTSNSRGAALPARLTVEDCRRLVKDRLGHVVETMPGEYKRVYDSCSQLA